jgi:hypothetical protein
VGFSTVNSASGKCSSSKEAATDIVAFYQEWIKDRHVSTAVSKFFAAD